MDEKLLECEFEGKIKTSFTYSYYLIAIIIIIPLRFTFLSEAYLLKSYPESPALLSCFHHSYNYHYYLLVDKRINKSI